MMKALKAFDRIAIVLFNLFLLLVSILTPAIVIASSPAFYREQFERTGVYATVNENGEEERKIIPYVGGVWSQQARFTDEQLDRIIVHIVDYLFTDRESFALTMDNVEINGNIRNDVEIFSDVAVEHMAEVKELFTLVVILTSVFILLLLGLIVYLVCRRKSVAPLLLKYSLIAYGIFLSLGGTFCLWVFADSKETGLEFTTQLWRNFHHILFPFQSDKFDGSFFNDTLTQVLSLDFFMGAVATVLTVVLIVLASWFVFVTIARIRSKKRA